MAMASTTKIMTCILVLENAKVEEEVSISAYAATMPKVKLYVKKGEHYTVRELLFSLMLESHNDAAAALAEYIGGKLLGETKEASEHTAEESKAALHRFAQAMNEKAAEIGCEDTWFITPNGLMQQRQLHYLTAAFWKRSTIPQQRIWPVFYGTVSESLPREICSGRSPGHRSTASQKTDAPFSATITMLFCR